MAITKRFLKSKPICKVTFEFLECEVKEVFLIGDFNKWNTTASPLKKLKNGLFKVTIDLEIGQSYEYKFFVDGKYLNDPKAEAYQFNTYANAENSLLTV